MTTRTNFFRVFLKHPDLECLNRPATTSVVWRIDQHLLYTPQVPRCALCDAEMVVVRREPTVFAESSLPSYVSGTPNIRTWS